MTESRGIKIFLAHASDDKAAVLSLYERLKAQGYDPWVDKLNLLPGDKWREEIPKAIKSSDIFIACLSPRSVDKDGYVQQELRLALMECAQKSASGVYLIPLRLEPCKIPDIQLPSLGVNLRDYHWLDHWEADSFELLVRSIERKRPPSATSPQSPFSEPSTEAVVDSIPVTASEIPLRVSNVRLQRFSFEVVTLDCNGRMQDRNTQSAEHFLEELGGGVTLDMVHVPGGSFLMGSPADEIGHRTREMPQHEVEIQAFYLGRYPVTQAQWRIVASYQPVKRELNAEPSWFKGDHLPVESVSWYEVIEFCDRLTARLGHPYRLPSESEWEYACRGGSTTPFHFGETITTEVANYRGTDDEAYGWSGSYGGGPLGEYRQETTVVDFFNVANAFGLCEMHGNVWELCSDYWHGNYENAHIDGSPWLSSDKDTGRVVRGGSWYYSPEYCRSAIRYYNDPGYAGINMGFRLACSAS